MGIDSSTEGLPERSSQLASEGSASLSGIRDELLRQHVDLRARIAQVRASVNGWTSEDVSLGCAHRELLQLATALKAHTEYEERVLGTLMRGIDAWGAARVDMMNGQHLKEHADLHAVLISAAAAVEPAAWAFLVDHQLTRIEDHMTHEEASFLNEGVLRDDVVVVAQEAG